MKWGNDLPNDRKNILSMKYRYSTRRRYVHAASILSLVLTVFVSQCHTTELDSSSQTVQPPGESWKDEQKTTTTDESDILPLKAKTKDNTNNIAFMKPSKFDEHVDEDQYVDNPLQLANTTAKSSHTNVTRTHFSNTTSSANQITPNHTRSCDESAESTSSNLACNSTNLLDEHIDVVAMSSNDSHHSALVQKRTAVDSTDDIPTALLISSNLTSPSIYYKLDSQADDSISNKSTSFSSPGTEASSSANNGSSSLSTSDTSNSISKFSGSSSTNNVSIDDSISESSRSSSPNTSDTSSDSPNLTTPSDTLQPNSWSAAKSYHKLYLNESPSNGSIFKIKKETEDYRMLEKRMRQRTRVRRSLYQLPFNDMIYQPLHRRYYIHTSPSSRNHRMDVWEYDQHRRYVRFPLADPFRPSRPVNQPPPTAIWTPPQIPQLPQYTAYQQPLPPVPSMGPRSPRLVFRDPVEPGTLQAPFSPNGLQDLAAPEDNRGCGVSVAKQQTAQRRIVGGDEAGFGSFPWQAYIRIGSSRCGGTLVNRYHVVTAGHCVARATARQVQVTLGDYVINSAVEPLPAYTFGVRKINVHPYFKFTPQADRFDVAVLRLDRPVQYMPHIAPICLPEKDEDFLGQYGWAAGWGALQAGSRLRPKTLQAVDVPIIDNRQCERWHKSNGINVVIYEEMMCAGYRGGLKDSCQGDSGGPLMLEKTGRWYLIGIVSAGYSCAQRGQPGIYHRVAHTVDWISYIVNS